MTTPPDDPRADEGLVEAMARAIHAEWEMNKPIYERYGYPSGTGNPQLPWRMLARAALTAARSHGGM